MKRIHIVGCGPRSGTTLLAEAMKTCFEIDCFAEHEDSIYRHKSGCNIYLTKSPGDITRVRPFLWAMPALHVICMIRDPRDMIVSRHGSQPDKYWSSLSYWNNYIRFYRKVKRHPRVVTIRYEDMVRKPDAVQEQIISRLSFLPRRCRFSDFHLKAQPSADSVDALRGVRPISDASIGRWRQNVARVAGQIQLHGDITGDLIEFGYESGPDWRRVFDGVEPDLSPSAASDHLSWEEMSRRARLSRRMALRFYLSQRGLGLHRLSKWI